MRCGGRYNDVDLLVLVGLIKIERDTSLTDCSKVIVLVHALIEVPDINATSGYACNQKSDLAYCPFSADFGITDEDVLILKLG